MAVAPSGYLRVADVISLRRPEESRTTSTEWPRADSGAGTLEPAGTLSTSSGSLVEVSNVMCPGVSLTSSTAGRTTDPVSPDSAT